MLPRGWLFEARRSRLKMKSEVLLMENVTIPSSPNKANPSKGKLWTQVLSGTALAMEMAFLIWGFSFFLSLPAQSQDMKIGGCLIVVMIGLVSVAYSLLVFIKNSRLSRGTYFTWSIVGGVGWLLYVFFLALETVGVLLAAILLPGFASLFVGTNSESSSASTSVSSTVSSSTSTSLDPGLVALTNGLAFLVILGIVMVIILIARIVFVGSLSSMKAKENKKMLGFFITTLLAVLGFVVCFGLNLALACQNSFSTPFGFTLPMLLAIIAQFVADYFAIRDSQETIKPYPEEVELGQSETKD